MADMNVQAGDVVKLKSGGPSMTVMRITEQGKAVCQWFVGGKLNTPTSSGRAWSLLLGRGG